jgi:DNA-directed RNA polymerase specialized sigma24 family protein
VIRSSNRDKCTESDYQRMFTTSREQLHWLCYTLTGNAELSDQALDAALQQSLKGAGEVFRDWMWSWARRLIVKLCIAIVRPSAPKSEDRTCTCRDAESGSLSASEREILLSLPPEELQRRLLGIEPLERFAFVLRAFEGYSRHDAALLLDIEDRLCELAYLRAAKTLVQYEEDKELLFAGTILGAGYCLAQAGD